MTDEGGLQILQGIAYPLPQGLPPKQSVGEGGTRSVTDEGGFQILQGIAYFINL